MPLYNRQMLLPQWCLLLPQWCYCNVTATDKQPTNLTLVLSSDTTELNNKNS